MSTNEKHKFPLHLPVYILALLLIILTSCIFSPLYMQVGNDVTYMYTVLPIILNYVILLFETMYISLLFSGAAYSAYAINKGTEKMIPSVVYPVSIIVLKHTLNLSVSSLIDSYIDISFDLPVTIILMLVDILIVTIVWIIADRKAKHHFTRAKKILKASKYLTIAEHENDIDVYPFRRFFDLSNPILASVFLGALIITASTMSQRAYADIFVLGAPASFFEVAEMILSYLLDLLIGLAGYATSYYAASYLMLREK